MAAAIFVLLSLSAAALSMLWGGSLAFRTFGWHFIVSTDWDPVNKQFGALVSIYGTVVSAFIAMIIAVPISFGIAFYITEIAPIWMRGPVAMAIELLAGIPSIIYGIWGLFVFVPFMSDYIEPWLDAKIGPLPLIGFLFAGPPLGIGMLTAGIILGIMVIPFDRAAAAFGRLAQTEMPFALSRSMNDAVKSTRNQLITQTWPTHVQVRNPSFIRFIRWALNVKYANKRSLTVEISDEKAQGRGHLGLHDTGGVKSARALQAVPG
jgi:hypothetical protein